ncbi:guanylate kinase [Rhizobiales bacterium TNE-4]|nr:guanylate kinase [Rhizobiales bacterium TNE-4]MBV1827274.1 guanylate kinase [Rhizobiales bacterium TNE-4]
MIEKLGNPEIGRRGLMLVLSSPSGAGKTTLTKLLRDEEPSLTLSISVTTRPRRPSEVDGVHYFFKTADEFKDLRDRGDLLEWAEVHGNFYGSPRKEIDKALSAGNDILFDIDYQGAMQVRKTAPDDVVSIFILPPSIPELRRRLERRAEDSATVIQQRLKNAKNEIDRWRDYDYVLVNDDLQATFAKIRAILAAERLKRERQTGLPKFISGLLAHL